MSADKSGIWLGLLKWSLQYQDGTKPSQFHEMSPEDKAWLEKVMKESIRDDVQVMTRCVEHLTKYLDGKDDRSADGDERTEGILMELEEITEQIDMANVFVKIGGPSCLVRTIRKEDLPLSVRMQAALCVSTMAQNNIQSQDAFVKEGLFEELMETMLVEKSSELRTKVFGSLSSIARGHRVAHMLMCGEKGIRIILESLRSDFLPLQRKAVFLMKAMVLSDKDTPAAATAVFGSPPTSHMLRAAISEAIDKLCSGVEDYALMEQCVQLAIYSMSDDHELMEKYRAPLLQLCDVKVNSFDSEPSADSIEEDVLKLWTDLRIVLHEELKNESVLLLS